jgi:hypothetical protein
VQALVLLMAVDRDVEQNGGNGVSPVGPLPDPG